MLYSSMRNLVASFIFVFVLSLTITAHSTPTFNQSQINNAMAQNLLGYTSVGDSPSIVRSAQAFHYLALVTHFNPAATDSQNRPLRDRAQEIPVGIITALAGAPFFLWVLRTAKNQGYW